MRMCSIKAVLAAFLFLLAGSSAQAADPVALPQKTCGANQVMVIEADGARCADFSNSLTFMCPEGQVVQGVAYGKPVCVTGPRPMVAGQYQWSASGLCRYPNPVTKSCTCPDGYMAIPSMETYEPRCSYRLMDDKKKVKSCAETQFTCYRRDQGFTAPAASEEKE